jgi:H+/Cl- antiporter ClcA
VFIVGSAIGRFTGEVVSRAFPGGIRNDPERMVYPGLYSLVGAAAMSGGVTHTISVAIIAMEITVS